MLHVHSRTAVCFSLSALKPGAWEQQATTADEVFVWLSCPSRYVLISLEIFGRDPISVPEATAG